jgi:hypothetical protein
MLAYSCTSRFSGPAAAWVGLAYFGTAGRARHSVRAMDFQTELNSAWFFVWPTPRKE